MLHFDCIAEITAEAFIIIKDAMLIHSHTLRSGFHYETYIVFSPYHTLAVVELQYMAIVN